MTAIAPALHYDRTNDLSRGMFKDTYQTETVDVTAAEDGTPAIRHSAQDTESTHFTDNSSTHPVYNQQVPVEAGSPLATQAQKLLEAASAANVTSLSEGLTSEGPGFSWSPAQGMGFAATLDRVPQSVQGVFMLARSFANELPAE